MQRILLTVLACALVAGCTTPDESRDYADSPEDATTGDGGQQEVSGTLNVEPNESASNESVTNETEGGADTSPPP